MQFRSTLTGERPKMNEKLDQPANIIMETVREDRNDSVNLFPTGNSYNSRGESSSMFRKSGGLANILSGLSSRFNKNRAS